MKVDFLCQKCNSSGGPGAALIGAALNAFIELGKMPTERDTVVQCGSALLVALLDVYSLKVDDTAGAVERLELELVALEAALRNPSDDVVRALGVVNRQAMWMVLSLLKKERSKRVQEEEKAAAEEVTAEEGRA